MKRVPAVKKELTKDQFIKGGKGGFPWDDANDRVIKAFNLRLPESAHMKLKFIAEKTPHSIHGFIMDAVIEAIEREIENPTK